MAVRVSFRIVWWWIMVVLQLLGEELLLKCYQSPGISHSHNHFSSLSFEFNVLYGLLLLLNFLVRKKLVIEDERIFRSFKLGIHMQILLLTDALGIALSTYYISQGAALIVGSCW